MNGKNLLRALIAAGVVLWPTFETYRYVVAKQQLAQSIELRDSVLAKLDVARTEFAQAESGKAVQDDSVQ